jgi:hypothetical protein
MNVTTASPFPDDDDYSETEAVDSSIAEFTDTQIDGTFGPVETAVVAAETECPDAVVAIIDGPGDHTVRPVPPSLRPYMGRHPRPLPPPADS